MLSEMAVRSARPRAKAYKLNDGRGLYLLVNSNGSKWWRFKYCWLGKEKGLSLGVYPDVPLSLARDRREEARRQVAAGVDPSAKRQSETCGSGNIRGDRA